MVPAFMWGSSAVTRARRGGLDGCPMPWTQCTLKAARARVDIARMLIGAALLLCILSVPLAGGRLSALADLEFRRGWLAVGALVVQVLIISVLPGGARGLDEEVHLA